MSAVGETLARHLACFGTLPDTDREAVASLDGEVRPLKRHRDVIRAGEHPNEIVLVMSGMLYRYALTPDGGRQIHSFYVPTEAPSLETLYTDYMDNNVGAAVDSRIGLVPHHLVYQLIDERPEVRKLLWRQTLVQAAIFRQWLVRNSHLPAHASLAHFFCEMLARSKAAGVAEGDSCDLPLTQEYVADALGLTSVHLNRTLRVLRDTGCVQWRGGRLEVRNLEQLGDIADFDDRYLHLRCS